METQRMTPMFDEMNASPEAVREHYQIYQRWLARQPLSVCFRHIART